MSKNIVEALVSKKNLVVLCNQGDYNSLMDDLWKSIDNKFEKVCLIESNRGINEVVSRMEKSYPKFNFEKFIFINCSRNKTKSSKIKCFNIASLGSLTNISIDLFNIVAKEKVDLVVFDNISSFMIYNKEVMLMKFLQSIVSKLKSTKTKLLLILMEKDFKDLIKDIELFTDDIVKYKFSQAKK